tara:strand:- start:881 stop:1282 length:402 start_codon:yes stop_codon:yes gene_type:complete
MKLSLILGAMLIVSVGGSFWYIDYLQDQISILKGNQIALESKVQEQNDAIDKYLQQQKENQTKLNDMALANQQAQREVNKLRSTFAKHDLDNLAINKPGLVEKMVNRGTKRVLDEMVALTDPNQFDKKDEESP